MTLDGGAPVFAPGHPMLERSMADVIAGVFRIRLAKQDFVLPVLTYGENDEWERTLDADLRPLIEDETDAAAAIELLQRYSDHLLDLVYAYDRTHVLPPIKELRPNVYPNEAMLAVWEVRAALNPTLGLTLAAVFEESRRTVEEATSEALRSARQVSTSSSPRATGGPSKRSKRSRLSNSSSSTSTRRKSD